MSYSSASITIRARTGIRAALSCESSALTLCRIWLWLYMIGAPVTVTECYCNQRLGLSPLHALHHAMPCMPLAMAMPWGRLPRALAFGNEQAGRVLGNGIESPCDICGVDRLARMYRYLGIGPMPLRSGLPVNMLQTGCDSPLTVCDPQLSTGPATGRGPGSRAASRYRDTVFSFG